MSDQTTISNQLNIAIEQLQDAHKETDDAIAVAKLGYVIRELKRMQDHQDD